MNTDKQAVMDNIIDLLTKFDEMGFQPTTTVPNPEAYAIKWRDELTKALIDYHKQSENTEEYRERIYNQREELSRLNKRINDLIQSREAWKKKAERVGKQSDKGICTMCEIGAKTLHQNKIFEKGEKK